MRKNIILRKPNTEKNENEEKSEFQKDIAVSSNIAALKHEIKSKEYEDQVTTNLCPDHPSEQKEFLCLICKKIYCHECYRKDKAHRLKIKPLSVEMLANYELEEYLGAGTFGFVFKVISLGENRPYALKVINDVETQEDFDRVSTETKLHATMSHPNIIKYISSFRIKSEGVYVVLLELADSSLESEILSLSQETAFCYFTQIAEALKYLHEDLKIAHRDLKPQNILLKQGVVKLCDMGEAKLMTKKMQTLSYSRGFGTTNYLPPEVLNGQKYSEKSDIWSAGIVFHAMLSKGKHPFDHTGVRDENEIVENVKKMNINYDESIKEPKYLKILESIVLSTNIISLNVHRLFAVR